MRSVILASIWLVTAAADRPAEPSGTRAISPQQFFQGRTESRGKIRQLFTRTRTVVSHGHGHVDPDGTLVLNQIVETSGEAPKQRKWRLYEDRVGHCTGTVTDGVGPVDGKLTGNQLHMRFKLKGGLSVEQWLSFNPDGRSATNRIKVRKLGISVASIDEAIRKMD